MPITTPLVTRKVNFTIVITGQFELKNEEPTPIAQFRQEILDQFQEDPNELLAGSDWDISSSSIQVHDHEQEARK
jgi:hypothetical protein